MANVKVSELPAASAASTSQEFEVNDSGTSKKVTGSQIKSFVKDGLVLTDITDVTASITELNYVDGVTSSVQDQLNDKFKQRTITGTTDQITVTNGDGVAGNPTIAAVIASQAEAEAGTDTTKLMTPQRIRNAFNATGSAPLYACRAWVNFNGTGTVAIRGSGNVSSITDLGVGTYRINFGTAMPNTNYSVSHFSKWSGGPYILGVASGATSYTLSGLTVINGTAGGVDTDIDVLSIAIFC